MALALVHAHPETAEENVTLLLRRINEASSLLTRQLWAEMVDKTAVRAEGRVLFAKLHGRIASVWGEIVFRRDSLFAHSGATPTNRRAATPVPLPTATPFRGVAPAAQPTAAPAATAPAVPQAIVEEVEAEAPTPPPTSAPAQPTPTAAPSPPTPRETRGSPSSTPHRQR